MRSALAVLVLLTLVVSFLSFRQSGWLQSLSQNLGAQAGHASQKELDAAALWRHQHVQPTHWKAYLLRRD